MTRHELTLKYLPQVVPAHAEVLGEGVYSWEHPGSRVILPMFTADPLKATEEWLEAQKEGSTLDGFEREILISFDSWSGKRVYGEWNDALHLAKKTLPWFPDRLIFVGIDIPGPPAAVWGQMVPIKRGNAIVAFRLNILADLLSDGSIEEFGRSVLAINAQRFPGAKNFRYIADPAAFNSISGVKTTAAEILKEFCGLHLKPGPINLIDRTEPVRRWLKQTVPVDSALDLPGALQLDPGCHLLKDAFHGGYHYPVVKATGQYKAEPSKNESSHPANALEYLCWAAQPEVESQKEDMPKIRWSPEAVIGALE